MGKMAFKVYSTPTRFMISCYECGKNLPLLKSSEDAEFATIAELSRRERLGVQKINVKF
jgi:hypothetical protein